MDSQQIRLSALGRDVQVGNFYNYENDFISSCDVQVPQGVISVDNKSQFETKWFELPQLPELMYDVLGIDAHLRNSIENKSVDLTQLWFAEFLKPNESKDDANLAQVSFLLRVVRRIKTLDPKFLESKLSEFQLQSGGGRATRLVEQVVYGAELICSFKRTLTCRREAKENAEKSLGSAVTGYFNQIFGNSANPDLPTELNNVECKIISSIDDSNYLRGLCPLVIHYLKNVLSFYKSDRVEKWKPIEITLRRIPEFSHREFRHHETSIDMDCATETTPPDDIENDDQLSNQRIAEFFADEKNRCAKLIKKGQPNVYLLNATDTSVSQDLRWFDVGRPVRSPPTCMKNHKLIILMGATGCGKSTLINGMVNYILGVKWNDPFRFKCVREDETTARNQAHSQTSSVTAYTIRHHDGMTVPYSITIIDTPGYGNTRGVKRDKEITRNIQQFLTQQESRVEEIHAACFVAASGDCRLTTTQPQRYIIDSALSIFGKDIKENIRLLVTFADNADPLVVDACRAADFPVTSASAGIIFSKFNSSVLYASNEQQEEDLCFDELFWDMGQENFSKFFSMLEGMNGRNLESTREVIQRRTLLEESLKDIEQELEVCLFNIENIDKFQRKIKECSHMMESSKDLVFENKEVCYSRVPCQNGFYAYNCHRCQKTCESPIHCANLTELRKNKGGCSHLACPHHPSEHDYENVEIRRTVKKTKKTLLDMKAKFESSSNEKMTNERLLADCLENLEIAKAKMFCLLDQVGENVRSLESTALRSNTLSPADYLSLMRSRVAEEQKPGYQIRMETLSELQQSLADDEAAKSQQDWSYLIHTSLFGIWGSSRGLRRRGVFRPSSFTRSNSK